MYRKSILLLLCAWSVLHAGNDCVIYSPEAEAFINAVHLRLTALHSHSTDDPQNLKMFHDNIIDQVIMLVKLNAENPVIPQDFNKCSQEILGRIPRVVYDTKQKKINYKIGEKSIQSFGELFHV